MSWIICGRCILMIESVSRNRWRYHKRLSKQFRTVGNYYEPNRACKSFCITLCPTFKSTVMSKLLVNAPIPYLHTSTQSDVPSHVSLTHFTLLSCSSLDFWIFDVWTLKSQRSKESKNRLGTELVLHLIFLFYNFFFSIFL